MILEPPAASHLRASAVLTHVNQALAEVQLRLFNGMKLRISSQ
jgi:hypothetical protein